MKNLFRFSILIAAAGVALCGPKRALDLQKTSGRVDVIVQYRRTPNEVELNRLGSARRIKKFASIHAAVASLTEAEIESLEADPNVAYISPDRSVTPFLDITAPSVNATYAWKMGYDGTGIGVAIIDSGVYQHPDLSSAGGAPTPPGPHGPPTPAAPLTPGSRVVYSQSFISGLNASDQFGHGTHVAGILASDAKDSTGPPFTRSYRGIAPNANIINLRVLDANGVGTDSEVIAAIDAAIQLQAKYNIRVINLSLGRPVYESYALDPLCQAVEAAWNAGIVVVVAAGNYGREDYLQTMGYGTIASPGNDPYVITVGAMNSMGTPNINDDKICSYTSKGPTAYDHFVKPDLVAPGNNVVSLMDPNSTLATQYPNLLIPVSTYDPGVPGTSGTYMMLSGTSMATPVVSGAAVLLLQQTPSLTPDEVKARLMKTANKNLNPVTVTVDPTTLMTYVDQADVFTVGAGYVDIEAALNNTDLVRLPALSPTADLVKSKDVTMVRNFSLVWGDSMVWGDAVVYGTSAFVSIVNGASVIWGDSMVWGDTSIAGNSLIWGDSVLGATAAQAQALSPAASDSSQQ
ncbi:MAG TPA: S8 family serine peptidase [Bryobacteraceae bacterium]|nr:S8 family serine peptidase [Bryobacteraceae bacterium]